MSQEVLDIIYLLETFPRRGGRRARPNGDHGLLLASGGNVPLCLLDGQPATVCRYASIPNAGLIGEATTYWHVSEVLGKNDAR